STSPANDSTTDGEEATPVFGIPSVEKGFEAKLGFRVETIVAEDTVVRRKWHDHLGWTRFETTLRFLCFDGTKESDNVGQHDTMGKLGFGVNAVNFPTVLRDS